MREIEINHQRLKELIRTYKDYAEHVINNVPASDIKWYSKCYVRGDKIIRRLKNTIKEIERERDEPMTAEEFLLLDRSIAEVVEIQQRLK